MHEGPIEFCKKVAGKYAHFGWRDARALDVGAADINGNNRALFATKNVIGVDVVAGKNVDLRMPAHLLTFRDGYFDVIVSTEVAEHDIYWQETMRNCIRMLASGGIMLFTCAGSGRPEHGTTKNKPQDAPGLPWPDYYQNLDQIDFERAINLDAAFSQYSFERNSYFCDTYFVGVRR